jgi:hypothetical protein
MRRVARLAGFLALVWLVTSLVAAKDARAGWSGWRGPYGGYGTIDAACQSWSWMIGAYIFWTYNPNPGQPEPNEVVCHGQYGVAGIMPVCVSGVNDATQPSGCRPVNAAPVNKELGYYCPVRGNPICVAGGNKFENVTDFETPTPDKLGFVRYFNSGNPGAPPTILGSGWRSVFDSFIDTTNSSGPVYIYRPEGQVLTMDFNSSTGWYPNESDVDLKLTHSGSTWTLTDSDDTVWTYTNLTSNAAVLSSIKRRSGYTQTLQYNASNQLSSVTDSYGRTLTFTLQNGVVQTMTVPDGSVYSYIYQTSSGGGATQLVRVVKPGHSPTSPPQNYVYENTSFPFALTGIVDDNGNRYATFTLEQYGRPTTSQHAGGADSTSVTYGDTDNSRVISNPLNEQDTYHFSFVQNARKVTEIDRAASASTPAASSFYSYDANGFLSSTTDWNGIVTTRTNDPRGLPLSVTAASGTPQARTVTYTGTRPIACRRRSSSPGAPPISPTRTACSSPRPRLTRRRRPCPTAPTGARGAGPTPTRRRAWSRR